MATPSLAPTAPPPTQSQIFYICGVCNEISRHISPPYTSDRSSGCLNCGHASQSSSDGSEHQDCFSSQFGPCRQTVFTSGYRCAKCGDLIQANAHERGELNYCTMCGCRLVTSGGSTPAWLMRRFVVAQDNWKVLQLLETKWVEGPSWKEARG